MIKNQQQERLMLQLEKVEQLAATSKLRRLMHHPLNYLKAIGFRQLVYPVLKKGWMVHATSFWGEPFQVCLPAGTDIFLTGGKSDPSEIKLARFIISQLSEGDTFIDVGSHFGYFSRLALETMNNKGTVIAIEPAATAFRILKNNLSGYTGATVLNCLAGSQRGERPFYEFPVTYSEFNTSYPEQFEEKEWFARRKFTPRTLPTISLDALFAERKIKPTLIKIDTEGSEPDVILGLQHTVKSDPVSVSLWSIYAHPGTTKRTRKLLTC